MSFRAARGGFFDKKRVLSATTRAERQVLSRFGAFVRRRAKSSIRKRKAISNPGAPPSSHVGTYRRLIFFSYDPGRRSVVIGPTQNRVGSAVPRLLEKGGDVTVKTKRGIARLRYRARPHMGPAFKAELPGVPQLWRNSVK